MTKPATTTPFDAFEMPRDLPYPASPDYRCGQYGRWELKAKSKVTYERGYFTGWADEPTGHYIVRDGHCWMSTSRLELESHAVHLKHAKGKVVVCGVGMGMYLFNVARLPQVTEVIAVDRDPDVMEMVRQATGLDAWEGKEKVRFVLRDALELNPDLIGRDPVDFLYVDIWPELGDPDAVSNTQAIQEVVNAARVGWWGQEVDFIQWVSDHRPPGHTPVVADMADFARETGLPVEEQTSPSYLAGCRQAAAVFSTYGTLPFASAART